MRCGCSKPLAYHPYLPIPSAHLPPVFSDPTLSCNLASQPDRITHPYGPAPTAQQLQTSGRLVNLKTSAPCLSVRGCHALLHLCHLCQVRDVMPHNSTPNTASQDGRVPGFLPVQVAHQAAPCRPRAKDPPPILVTRFHSPPCCRCRRWCPVRPPHWAPQCSASPCCARGTPTTSSLTLLLWEAPSGERALESRLRRRFAATWVRLPAHGTHDAMPPWPRQHHRPVPPRCLSLPERPCYLVGWLWWLRACRLYHAPSAESSPALTAVQAFCTNSTSACNLVHLHNT